MHKALLTILASMLFLSAGFLWAVTDKPLSLEAFLGQVKVQGKGFRASADAVRGLSKQKVQTDLMYSPKLVGHAVRLDDRQQQSVPSLYGDRTLADDYGIALVKQWKCGLTTSLDYGWTRTQIDGSSFASNTPSYQARPGASVTMPLWRDFLGRQTRAQMDKSRYQIESAEFSAAHQREGLLYQARNAYWNLRLSRDEVAIRKDTLARAVTIVGWAERRVRLRLADDSEALQAQAMKQVRELELEQALERERTARIEFNRLRGVEGEEVPESLETLDLQVSMLSFQWPDKSPRRWDVRSAEATIKADKAAWVDAKANTCPDFNLYASYTANGLDSSYNPAYEESIKGRYPTTKVGGQIVIPLDVFTAKKAADGYELNYQSSKLSYDDKTLEALQDWVHLKRRLEDVNHKLALVVEIEKIQKEKTEKERERLRAGRTTQYQVQSYEGDYSSARLQRLSTLAEKLSVWAEGEWVLSADRENASQTEGTKP